MYSESKEPKEHDGEIDSQRWLQKIIVLCLGVGIGKRELFEDYYFDEVIVVLGEHYKRDKNEEGSPQVEEVEEVGAEGFFGSILGSR